MVPLPLDVRAKLAELELELSEGSLRHGDDDLLPQVSRCSRLGFIPMFQCPFPRCPRSSWDRCELRPTVRVFVCPGIASERTVLVDSSFPS